MFNRRQLGIKIAHLIVDHRVSVPTWVVLYVNILIGLVVMNYSYLSTDASIDTLPPLGGKLWSVLLVASCALTLLGLYLKRHRFVAVGAIFGYMAWAMALIAWFVDENQKSYGIPLLTLPMIGFFVFLRLKHSLIQGWEEELNDKEV